jgi:hypothetical protein
MTPVRAKINHHAELGLLEVNERLNAGDVYVQDGE